MAWTQYMDMHSGGGTKIRGVEYVYIEAPRKEADAIFEEKFQRDPYHVSCECCGDDYSVTESESLEQATAYERGCEWDEREQRWTEAPSKRNRNYVTLPDYLKRKDIRVVRA